MKKNLNKNLALILSVILSVSIVFALPLQASAADSNSVAGIVSISSGSLNVRSSSSSTSTVVYTLYNNTTVTLLSKSGSWWYVEYAAGKYGYCYADYIKQVPGSYAAYIQLSSGSLNVRTGPGTSYSIQNYLASGSRIVVLSQSGTWSRILYYGTSIGYVSSSYVKSYTTTAAYPAISLNMQNFKQTDSRWSSYPLGTNGKTIATAGCLTTALAMTESYRTGTIIYPNQMATRLTYMADATLYWPSNYVFSTNSSYLQAIYAQLKAGKPVLFGAKNSYGGQHWVVIKGYTGGSTLSAANFTINDPGSNTRTTLQQLLAAYPTFYRIAYYQ